MGPEAIARVLGGPLFFEIRRFVSRPRSKFRRYLFPFKKVKEFSVSVLFTCPQFRGNPLITANLQEIRITVV